MKVFSIELALNEESNSNERERFNAACITFASILFKQEVGGYDGFSRYLTKSTTVCSHDFLIIDSDKNTNIKDYVLIEIERIIENFNIKSFCTLKVNDSYESSFDYYKLIKEQTQFTWTWRK